MLSSKDTYNTHIYPETHNWIKIITNSISQPFHLPLKVKVRSLSHVRLFVTPWTVATRLLCPWDFPGKSTGVGCHCLLQEIFPTQGLNPGLVHCKQTLYRLSHQGSLIYLYVKLNKVKTNKQTKKKNTSNCGLFIN